jgi:hypothetical protein
MSFSSVAVEALLPPDPNSVAPDLHALNAFFCFSDSRDNDHAYGHVFTTWVRAMGIRDRPFILANLPSAFMERPRHGILNGMPISWPNDRECSIQLSEKTKQLAAADWQNEPTTQK